MRRGVVIVSIIVIGIVVAMLVYNKGNKSYTSGYDGSEHIVVVETEPIVDEVEEPVVDDTEVVTEVDAEIETGADNSDTGADVDDDRIQRENAEDNANVEYSFDVPSVIAESDQWAEYLESGYFIDGINFRMHDDMIDSMSYADDFIVEIYSDEDGVSITVYDYSWNELADFS